jgi:hypothetical protein
MGIWGPAAVAWLLEIVDQVVTYQIGSNLFGAAASALACALDREVRRAPAPPWGSELVDGHVVVPFSVFEAVLQALRRCRDLSEDLPPPRDGFASRATEAEARLGRSGGVAREALGALAAVGFGGAA